MAHQHTKDHYITAPLNGTEIKNGKIMISKMQKSTLSGPAKPRKVL